MTYDEYKDKQDMFRRHGLLQFLKLFQIHKDRQIDEADLHWGEEIEYHLYKFDQDNQIVQLSCDGDVLIEQLNTKLEDGSQHKPDFKLLPEFGNWMIEAVPTDAYGPYSDPEQLLVCRDKIFNR